MASRSLERLDAAAKEVGGESLTFEADTADLERLSQLPGEVAERFGGEVPPRMADLVTLPGVGRKTANVVLGNAFGIPGLPVDTHVLRLSHRLGLSAQDDPVAVEEDLCGLIPKRDWTQFSHHLILHGLDLRRPPIRQLPNRHMPNTLGMCLIARAGRLR